MLLKRGHMRLVIDCLAAVGLVVLVSAPPSAAVAEPSAFLTQKAPKAAALVQATEQKGYASVIVEFAPPIPRDQMRPDPAVLEPVKARIRATQDAIIADHFGSAANPTAGLGFARGIRRLDISPMFGVNVGARELEALAADPRVLHIHENALLKPLLEQSVPLIGMTNAYAAGATGNGYAVAVVDTGVKSDHPFLNGKVVMEACFSNNGGFGNGNGATVSTCPNGQPTQTGAGSASPTSAGCMNGSTNLCYHGTHVAGIAAGLNTGIGNGGPPNGVAKNADIVAVQVFTKFTSPSVSVSAFTTDIISALNYIYSNLNSLPGGIKLAAVNMSLGSGLYASACDSDPTKSSIDNLLAAGVATVIAAGNDGSTNAVASPGCVSSAVTVGSSTKGDTISSFTNMASMVDLMAPGGSGLGQCNGGISSDIHSALVTGTTSTFGCLAGTSMATPHVAGAFAALRSMAPAASVAQILAALQSTGTAIQDTRSGGSVTKPRIRVDVADQILNGSNPILLISPQTNIAPSGGQGGPFSPVSFQYTISTNSGSADFSISGLPAWLTASTTYGTATTTGIPVTFNVNSAANSLGLGTYGPYSITFTNTTTGLGNDSRTATLTVNLPPPVNDMFAKPTMIQAGQTLIGTNVGATFETGETEHNAQYADLGGASVWWRFVAPASGAFTLNTCGSNFDTVLAVYNGSAVNALTLVAGNDDASIGPCAGTHQSYVSFNAVGGMTYSIVVDGYNGGSGAANGNIQLALSAGPSPTLVVMPVTNMVSIGNLGGPFSSLSFQYQLNASTGSLNYSISGVPTWLTASSVSGTVTTSPSTITFTVNSSANSLVVGTYSAVIAFANTSNGQGSRTVNATLQVNSKDAGTAYSVGRRKWRN